MRKLFCLMLIWLSDIILFNRNGVTSILNIKVAMKRRKALSSIITREMIKCAMLMLFTRRRI